MKKLNNRINRMDVISLSKKSDYWKVSSFSTIKREFTLPKRHFFSLRKKAEYSISHVFIDRLNSDFSIHSTYHSISIIFKGEEFFFDPFTLKGKFLAIPYIKGLHANKLDSPEGHLPFVYVERGSFVDNTKTPYIDFLFDTLKEYIFDFFGIEDTYDLSLEVEEYHYSLSYAKIYNKKTLMKNTDNENEMFSVDEMKVMDIDEKESYRCHAENARLRNKVLSPYDLYKLHNRFNFS